jgi:glycosyltransferase involved in cell wall biosynthesis
MKTQKDFQHSPENAFNESGENQVPLPVLAIVIPCYNEEEIIEDSHQRLAALLDDLILRKEVNVGSFLLFVSDGSTDKTFSYIKANASCHVKGLRLSSNVGHQNALLAGMHYVTNKADCIVSIDADLQDDIGIIGEMLRLYRVGIRIVYGVRKMRHSDTYFKRFSAQIFYRMMRLMGVRLLYNHSDFRLVSNSVLTELRKYKEVNLFLRGIFPMMGFSSAEVYYDRLERTGGRTKYPLRKMIHLAVNGITSFSNAPLKLITWLGLVIFTISLIMSGWAILVIIRGRNIPGWASITLPIYLLGGVQLLALGILGEYISKIYLETKQRPNYHIEEMV